MRFSEILQALGFTGCLRVAFTLALLMIIGYALMRSIRPEKRKYQLSRYYWAVALCAIMIWLILEPIVWFVACLGLGWSIAIAYLAMVIGSALEDQI